MSDIPLSGFSSPNVKGSGHLQLGDAWQALYDANQTFSANTPALATGAIDASSALTIGVGALAFTAGGGAAAQGRLRLFWPKPQREKDPLLDATTVYPAFDDEPADGTGPLALLLALEGHGELSGGAPALKSGSLAGALDLKTGGDLSYARLIIGRQTDSVRGLLDRLVTGLRLPQEPKRLPAGEAIALTYGGYVKFTSSLVWGYALSGTRDLGAGSFASTVAYSAKVGPKLSLAAEAAGRFSFVTTAIPDQPRWVRLAVQRSSTDAVDAAFDVGVEASYEVSGNAVDRSLYESIALLLGLDAQAVAKAVAQIGAAPTLDQLPTILNGVFAREIDALLAKWSTTGDAATLAAMISRAASAYANLDQKVHAFLADRLGQTSAALAAEISTVMDATVLAQHLGMPNSPVWQKLESWFLGEASDWLRSPAPVAAAHKALERLQQLVLDATEGGVHDFMAAFDPAQKLPGLLAQLSAIQSEADLRTKVSAEAQALMAHLLEKPFAQLTDAAVVKDAFAALQKIQQQVGSLQDRWKELVKKAAAQSFTGQFAAAYKRADSRDALLEADFLMPEAKDWYEKALKGDFTALLPAPNSLVRLQRGAIDREISRASTISIALFANSLSSTFKLTQKSTLALETNAAGQIAIDTTETAALREDDRDWFGDREKKLSRLAVMSSGPVSSDPKLGRLLASTVTIGVNYDISIEDNRTSSDELRAYLRFAEELGLTATGQALADKLIALLKPEDPDDLGKLEARYAVSFAPGVITDVFTRLSAFEIRYYAAAARRRYYERFYASRRSDVPVIGYAYNFQQGTRYPMKDWFDGNVRNGQVAATIFESQRVPVPGGKSALIGFHSDSLVRLYTTEARGLAALVAFDAVVDRVAAQKPVSDDEFNRAVLDLMDAREALDVFLPANYSAMFAMIDGLAAYAYGNHASARRSKLDLTLTPNRPNPIPVNLTLAS